MKLLISTAVLAAVFYAGYGIFLFLVQRSLLYYPTPELPHDYTEETFETGESIRVIVTHPGKPRAVMYFGGNADSLVTTAPEFAAVLPDTTVYFVNYRGYAGSTGTPTEKGICHDALMIFDKLKDRHTTIAVIGRSLGSGVATYIASQRDVDRLVLITPFDSVVAMVRGLFPIYPAALIVKDKFDSIGRADAITVPTLVLIARNDSVIPRERSRAQVDALNPDIVEAHVLPGTDHNDISYHPEYYDRIKSFLDDGLRTHRG